LQSHSFCAYRYKTPQRCRRTLLSASAVYGRPLGVSALSDQFAAGAVTMGERLGSDDARRSTQIADCADLVIVPT